jgi:predicted esterase
MLLNMFSLFGATLKTGTPARGSAVILPDTLTLYDSTRHRAIPIAIYKPLGKPRQVVIFSHGYGQNKGGDYRNYSYLTASLALKNCYVISIQHELPTDSLLPLTGNPQVVRKPFWERGADNIMFVISEIKKQQPTTMLKRIVLIGHSNGGDMTALFAQKYNGVATTIITLDNRRMPLPVLPGLKVCSIRSADQPADEGVLPDIVTQQQHNITITNTTVPHNNMDDSGTPAQHKELMWYIKRWVK